ncbi:hypothetical protein MACH26_40740 [Planctobacterium marinum]|uniref:Cyclic nucleotide-binding domain-containing protein n=1 Tax=Planctobacterium marinum TaxID=1631968 RepID=A0AA48KSF3_9ALTE|nr:hypothetical protein MACH26_40740 [Planctobacterium marinum]
MAEHVTEVKLKANEFLWQANQSQEYLYVLQNGLLYAYFETSEGKSFCKEVYWENDLIFGFRSLLSDNAFPFSVRSIEPSVLYRFPLQHYLSLVKKHHDWQAFHLSVVSEYYMYKEGKEEFLLLNTPEQRVALFFETYPHLLPRLPQHVIASYLGMTPISFSRIKKRLGLLTNVNAAG